jgi:uncharacterized UBP type Zn finger protein
MVHPNLRSLDMDGACYASILPTQSSCLCIFFVLIRYCILEQLEGMGFNRELVLEVFFACNKDEELAANYLLDHGHEFDEQQQ